MHNRHLDTLAALGRQLWITSLLWIIGRTLCRAARVDEAVRRELAPLPDGLTIRLEVGGMAQGLTIHKADGRWQSGPAPDAGALHPLRVRFKHPAIAFRALSFRLGVNQAFSENRLLVEGDLTVAMHLVRALEQLQALILPAFIARPLLRHYPDPSHKLSRACHIYLGLLTG
ncbi:SCP2 sterol-binding domain-containing protein [Aeromonas dhakensis]|uniref:SCP2 sterol-binding domain-containing protein n=1 Tax=Aeromonas dhakensis TaxID=196024 RepID=UPI00227A7C27|nr:SCP2 sterol-binding domain-containing protein [Aeromonas dhakensis]WAG12462.1 SCP2 sterol-binding domain-containing protein [Aeromonas dhakensis]